MQWFQWFSYLCTAFTAYAFKASIVRNLQFVFLRWLVPTTLGCWKTSAVCRLYCVLCTILYTARCN